MGLLILKPIFFSKRRSHTASLALLYLLMYSALHELSATVVCLFDDHETGPLTNIKMYIDVNCLLSKVLIFPA